MRDNIRRTFFLGDEWIFYKIYLSENSANQVLESLLESIKKLKSSKLINGWFFMRFYDPEHHIRIRFKVESNNHLPGVITEVKEALINYVQRDLVWKVDTSTYNRELERYGAERIELTEKIFELDSEIISSFLFSKSEALKDFQSEVFFALAHIDFILDTFQLTLKEKIGITKILKESFHLEFSTTIAAKKIINQKHKNLINNLNGKQSYYEKRFVSQQRKEYKNIAELILKTLSIGSTESKMDKFDYLASIIHMSLNRLFTSKNRIYELVIYDFAYKNYQKKAALTQLKKVEKKMH